MIRPGDHRPLDPRWLRPLAEAIIRDGSCTSAILLLAAWQARQGRGDSLHQLVLEASGVGCA